MKNFEERVNEIANQAPAHLDMLLIREFLHNNYESVEELSHFDRVYVYKGAFYWTEVGLDGFFTVIEIYSHHTDTLEEMHKILDDSGYTTEPEEIPARVLSKGMEVEIFEDPITCTRLEGKAVLLKKHPHRSETTEFWKVSFLSDNAIVDRFIKP